MRAIRQHTYTPPLHSGLLPPNCVALTAHKEQWTVTLASDCGCYDVFLSQHRLRELSRAAASAVLHDK